VGFAYLAAALKLAGHEVHGLNPNNDATHASAAQMLAKRLSRTLSEVRPELVCLGGLCVEFAFVRDAIRIVRQEAPDTPIVCGGGIVTHDAAFILNTLRPDFCIVGEGEEALLELAAAVQSGRQDYDAIPNIGYWKDGGPRFTSQSFEYPDLDSRAFPDYEPFAIDDMLDNYGLAARPIFRYTRTHPRPMTIVTARSCPFRCTFCVHQRGPRYRARSLAKVMDEIARLYERYHFNVLLIVDELFAVDKVRLRAFCEGVLRGRKEHHWDFDWLFQTHASAALTREDLALAKAAGCYYFGYGIESASPKVLASMNKKTKPQQIVAGITEAAEAKIGFGGNFIFGDVVETQETIVETLDFIRGHCLDNHVFLGALQPYPGSKLFDDCVSNGLIKNTLRFYEHIDERPINMTAIPGYLWFPWIQEVRRLGGASPWARATLASSCEVDAAAQGSGFALGSGMTVYRVRAQCPHCGGLCEYREPLPTPRRGNRQPGSALLRYAAKLRGICRRERSRLPAYACELVARKLGHLPFSLLKRHVPIFRELGKLETASAAMPAGFITGCTHCHKRLKISVAALPAPTAETPPSEGTPCRATPNA
jgi:hypothetical protein